MNNKILITLAAALACGYVTNDRNNLTQDNIKGVWVVYDTVHRNCIYWGSKSNAKKLI